MEEKKEVVAPLDVQEFTFDFGGELVRVRGGKRADGSKVFVAKDIAEGLQYEWNGTRTIEHVKEAWRGVESIPTPFGVQRMAVLTDKGVNMFCFRSDKPRAIPFQEWIAGDVLPQIDETGGYQAAPALERPKSSLEVMRAQHAMLGQLMDEAIEAKAERERIAAVQSEQAAKIQSVVLQVADLRESFETQLKAMQTSPVGDKPSGTESLTKIKALWNERRGLPEWVTEAVLTQVDKFRVMPKAYVGKGVLCDRQGNVRTRLDGSEIETPAFFAYQMGVVTDAMNRFIRECERHPSDKRKAVHPSFPDRPFNLAFGYAKGDQRAA